ncbi:epoxyqueuosine reductase QueH [bacterium]|nr:epoxyqueuosine reductase QueH [bacterium]
MQNKILLHACCAICSAYPIQHLIDLDYSPVVYFYNPNIFPRAEYNKRLEAQIKLCEYYNCELIQGEYSPEKYVDYVKGYEKEPEGGLRCNLCFDMRLKETAKKAKELGINNFTTSIVISPHKNFDKISEIGMNVSAVYGITYVAINFRKKDGFLKTNKIANGLGLYRQNYCGCQYSL